MTFAGAVLTGGASRRMGRDKALLELDGRPMAARVATALRAAGAGAVTCVGLAVPGEEVVADEHPGEGPLGGVLTALRWSPAAVVVVVACDLVAPDPAALARAVAQLEGAPVAVPVVDGREQWLHAAWAADVCREAVASAFAAGERSVAAVARSLGARTYPERAALSDADEPGDLPL